MHDLDELARGLSAKQRDAILSAHWLYPGGQEPIAVVDFTDPWPKGVAQFFTLREDRLTPLGLALRARLMEGQGGD